MPIYEYRCESCGSQIEKLQKISDPVLKDCPECGKASLVKLVSPSSFRLKGTGWYATDFRDSGKKGKKEDGKKSGEGNKEAGGDAKPAGGSGSSGGDAKAATKSSSESG